MQEYLGLLIAAARSRLKQAVLARVAEHGLTAPQFWVLVGLAEHPGLSQCALGERVRADAPTISRTLAALADRRLVRTDPDPADRRRTRVYLTPAGERMAARLRAVATQIREAVQAGMTPSEVAALRAGLRRVIANLDRLDERDAAPPRRERRS